MIEAMYEDNLEKGKKDAGKEYNQKKRKTEVVLAKKIELSRDLNQKRLSLKKIK